MNFNDYLKMISDVRKIYDEGKFGDPKDGFSYVKVEMHKPLEDEEILRQIKNTYPDITKENIEKILAINKTDLITALTKLRSLEVSF